MSESQDSQGRQDSEGAIAPLKKLPPIRYDLELIEKDGHLEWIEEPPQSPKQTEVDIE